MILVGDIGGTNTRLALFEKGKMFEEKKYPSQTYKSLEEIIGEYLQDKRVKKACFGIAGTIRNGVCKTTNIPWIVDAVQIGRTFHIPSVHLLNDLEANAYGLNVVKQEELYVLHEGKKQIGNQAIMAAGTGLGEACLYWDGQMHRPFACEGGHTDFAPRNEIETELFIYLKKKFGHVSYERVVSGPGIYNLFQFLIETGREQCSPALKEEMGKRDPSRVISEWGRENKDPACIHAVDWFISLYGSEAGNMALKFLSLGGFYLGGGIVPHLKEKMSEGTFLSSFVEKGRFKKLLESIPIYIILNDNAALLGAAFYGESYL